MIAERREMPTTSVWRRISLFRRSGGFVGTRGSLDALRVDAGDDHDGHVDSAPAFADLLGQGVDTDRCRARRREAATSSSDVASSKAWDVEIPRCPLSGTTSSTRRVDTPSTLHGATTATSARSARCLSSISQLRN
jgi:hypothetical protein